MGTIASRWLLVAWLCGSVFPFATNAQEAGRDVVLLDKQNLSPAQLQSLREQLGARLLDDTDQVLIAPRTDIADALQALQWPGMRPEDGVRLNPLQEIEGRMLLLKRVFGPVNAASAVELRAQRLRTHCLLQAKENSSAFNTCTRGLAELQKVAADLKASDPDCQPAAKAYLNYQADCLFSCPANGAAIKRDFDAACLASPLAWQRRDGSYRRDPLPALFQAGGNAAGVAGALDAVVLIEKDDAGNTLQHCGGLLLSRNRVLTAAHCFVQPGDQAALREGRMFARLIRNQGKDRYRLLPSGDLANEVPPVARDYLVLDFQADATVIAPRLEFREPDIAGPAVVLGYFADYDTGRVVQAEDVGGNPLRVPTWKLGLRWAKPGMCHVIETVQGCVRTLCQTIPGYSGAPVFSPQADPASPLIVHGIISGADSTGARCGKVDPLTTLAASAKDVAP